MKNEYNLIIKKQYKVFNVVGCQAGSKCWWGKVKRGENLAEVLTKPITKHTSIQDACSANVVMHIEGNIYGINRNLSVTDTVTIDGMNVQVYECDSDGNFKGKVIES